MPIKLDEGNREDALQEALAILDGGGLLCLPTETVYGIGCRSDLPKAVARLRLFKEGPSKQGPGKEGRPFTLHVADPATAFERGIGSPQARRLARSFWPGPLTLVLEDCEHEGRKLGFRVVRHPFTQELLRRAAAPLLLSSANKKGQKAAHDVESLDAAVKDAVGLVIDAGPCELGEASTVIAVDPKGRIEISREGAIDGELALLRAATLILFLCSGNTCRSPMAEGIARQLWARSLRVDPDQLLDCGYLVTSAGCMATPGRPASPFATQAMEDQGYDIAEHSSCNLEPALLVRASRIFCMGQNHLEMARLMLDQVGGSIEEDARAPELLAGDAEIEDPFGSPLAGYRETLEAIRSFIPKLPMG